MTCFNNLILLDGLSFALLFGKPFQWLQASVLYCWMVCQGLNFFYIVSTVIQASPEIMIYRLSYTISCLVYHFFTSISHHNTPQWSLGHGHAGQSCVSISMVSPLLVAIRLAAMAGFVLCLGIITRLPPPRAEVWLGCNIVNIIN